MSQRSRHPLIDKVIECQQREEINGSEVARRLGVNPSSWTRLVAGDMQPSIRIVRAIATAFPSIRSDCVDVLLIGTIRGDDRQKAAS